MVEVGHAAICIMFPEIGTTRRGGHGIVVME